MASSTYIKLINSIQAFCDAHLQIQRFDAEFGEQRPNLATDSEKYPYVFLEPTVIDGGYDVRNFTVTITCYDIIQKDRANINTIVSDCEANLQDIFAYYNQGLDSDIIALSQTKNPLNNFDLDYVAGWSMNIVFELEGWCTNAIPMNPIVPAPPETCDDATAVLKNTDGTQISSTDIASGSSQDITAPDATLTLNSASFIDVPSDTTEDIVLQDQDTNPITPDSVVGNTITVTTGATSLGLPLLKSGQTVSYRTGDDGDIEAGRDTDFLTLPSNNPFGNTNRFTDELGGATYTNGIAIDWSTYDGSEVLGYYFGDITTNRTFDNAIDWGVALSVGTFTTGWRLTNVRELSNLYNFSSIYVLNYAPFNSGNDNFWMSTGVAVSRGYAKQGQNLINYNVFGGASYKTMACRNFTNAELGI